MTISAPFRKPVLMRSHADESERATTPLELLFDLCFVVAIAALATGLHDSLHHGHYVAGLTNYASLFLPTWWAWMSFTWFATAFDNNDAVFRLLTLAQMAGVLVLAAVMPFTTWQNATAFTVAYAAMRLPLIMQWLRAARHDQSNRRFALRYAAGHAVAQLVWLAAVPVPAPTKLGVIALAIAIDLGTPMYATRVAASRVFHGGHIAERYGLFTLIVLGETILAVSLGLREGLTQDRSQVWALVVPSVSALIIAFAIWWLYFDAFSRHGLARSRPAAFVWGYGHGVLYAGIAAMGAGVHAYMVHPNTWFIAIPVAVAIAALSLIQWVANDRGRTGRWGLGAAAAIALLPLLEGGHADVMTVVAIAFLTGATAAALSARGE